MHGSAVASIAAGKTVGVAPKADIYYFAVNNTYTDKLGRFPTSDSNKVSSYIVGKFYEGSNCFGKLL